MTEYMIAGFGDWLVLSLLGLVFFIGLLIYKWLKKKIPDKWWPF